MTPLDMSLALAGYLRSAGGRLNYVHGLDVIALDIVRAGASVYWGEETQREAGYCDRSRLHIVLAPWLWICTGPLIRDVAAHELGHMVCRGTCETARAWQTRRCLSY